MQYHYIIDVPEQVSDGSILHLEIVSDLKETYGGYDYIRIELDSDTNQYKEYGLFVDWVDNVGATNRTLEYGVGGENGVKNLTILYERYLSQAEIDNWTTVRETGLALRWWVNNSEGHQLIDPLYCLLYTSPSPRDS